MANFNELNIALEYIAKGWAVFPVHKVVNGLCTCNNPDCKSPGKHPKLPNGLHAATKEANMARFWWNGAHRGSGVAIATGQVSGFFVVDVDIKEDGIRAWEYFKDDHNIDDCETVAQKTPSGGKHIFYAMPSEGKIKTTTNVLAKGIDIRGDGGYIVAYPSAGYEYLIGQDYHDFEPDEAPQAILDLALQKEIEQVDLLPSQFVELEYNSVEVEKIQSALYAITDFDDYDIWRNVGASLHDTKDKRSFVWWCEWAQQSDKYDHQEQVNLWNRFNQRESSLGRKINSDWLFDLASSDKFNWEYKPDVSDFYIDPELTTEDLTAARTSVVEATNNNPDALVSTKSVSVYNFSLLKQFNEKFPLEKLWDDGALFAGCTMMVCGEPKIGKSKFAVDFGMNAALGRDFLGKPFARPLKVLWLQAEIKEAFLEERFASFTELSDDEIALLDENFIFSGKLSVDVLKDENLSDLLYIIRDLSVDLVVVDPIINFSTANENDNKEVAYMLKRVDLLKKARCPQNKHEMTAVCLVHHMRKGCDPENPFDGIRGASAFRGYYDSGIALTPNVETNEVIDCHFEYRNQKTPEKIHVHFAEDLAIKQLENFGTFDDGSGAITSEEKQLTESLGLLENQVKLYVFTRDHLRENGKVQLEAFAKHVTKVEFQGLRHRTGVKRLLNKIATLTASKGGEWRVVNHQGDVWIELNKG